MEFRAPQNYYSIVFGNLEEEEVFIPKDIREFWKDNKQFWFSHSNIDNWQMEKLIYIDTADVNFRLVLYYDQISRHPTTLKKVISISNYTFATQLSLHIINTNQYSELEDHEKIFTLLALRHNNNLNMKYLVLEKIRRLLIENPEFNKSLLQRFLKATILDIDKYKCNNKYFKMEIIDKPEDIYLIHASSVIDRNLNFSKNNYNLEELYGKFLTTVEKSILDNEYENEIAISLSGGVDSMVLSYFMNIVCKRNNIILKFLHINYNNRDTCNNEISLLKYWALKLDCPLYIREIDEITRNNKSLRELYEDTTKTIRMNFYRYHNCNIFNGHNYEDTIENVFANLAKNKNYDNLKGMRKVSTVCGNTIVRPFLEITKDEIYRIAESLKIPHLINSTPEWSFRGRTREVLMDKIDTFDARILPGLNKLVLQHTFLIKQWNIMFDIWFKNKTNENKIIITRSDKQTEIEIIREKSDSFIETNMGSNREFWIKLWSSLNLGSFPSSKSINYLMKGINENLYNKYTINPRLYIIYRTGSIKIVSNS